MGVHDVATDRISTKVLAMFHDANTGGQMSDAPRDASWKSGSGGHVLHVVPSLDLVTWRLVGATAQYASSDTGVRTRPDAARQAPREKWKETVDSDAAEPRTLPRGLAATVPWARASPAGAAPPHNPIDLPSPH